MPPYNARNLNGGFDRIKLILSIVLLFVIIGGAYYFVVLSASHHNAAPLKAPLPEGPKNIVSTNNSLTAADNTVSTTTASTTASSNQNIIANDGEAISIGSNNFDDIKFVGASSYQPLFKELKITMLSSPARTLSVTLQDSAKISTVSATITTPSGSYSIAFNPASGSKDTWYAEWVLDPNDYAINYKDATIVLSASDNAGNSSAVTIKGDAPACPLASFSTEYGPCTVSDVVPLNTSISVSAPQDIIVMPGAVLAENPQNAINFTGGYIVVLGELEKGYVYYADKDNDGYGDVSQASISSATSLAGYVRSDIMSGPDCNDNNSQLSVSECTPGTQSCSVNLSSTARSRLGAAGETLNVNDLYICKIVSGNCGQWVKETTCPANISYTSNACYVGSSGSYSMVTSYNGCSVNRCDVSTSQVACTPN